MRRGKGNGEGGREGDRRGGIPNMLLNIKIIHP